MIIYRTLKKTLNTRVFAVQCIDRFGSTDKRIEGDIANASKRKSVYFKVETQRP